MTAAVPTWYRQWQTERPVEVATPTRTGHALIALVRSRHAELHRMPPQIRRHIDARRVIPVLELDRILIQLCDGRLEIGDET